MPYLVVPNAMPMKFLFARTRLAAVLGVLLLAAGLAGGCKKSATSSSFVPYVPVDFQFSSSAPSAYPLNTPGGHIYLPIGYRGVLVYRQNLDTYIATDRACPHNPSDPKEQVAVDSSGLYAVCPACSSRYSLDGTLLKGPSTQSLRTYNVDAGSDAIHIYN